MEKDCCEKPIKKEKGFLSGMIYGLVPHIGCIGFIILTLLGVTTATAFFKPLLYHAYFFYILILLSLLFAIISATIYLKRMDLLSKGGVKKKWKYLSVLFGTTIVVNLFLFMIIFPIAANMTLATPTTYSTINGLSEITLKVDIPCPGHAPLISEELKIINGVESIKFKFPNYFDIKYNSLKTSKEEILSLNVFNIYKASIFSSTEIKEINQPIGCSRCNTCDGGCGNSCNI